MPLWKNVESPMTPKTLRSVLAGASKALDMPMPTLKPAAHAHDAVERVEGAEPPRV